ncbi:hypothetical protein ABTD92_20875, partial [Acinetobacter baumannii]
MTRIYTNTSIPKFNTRALTTGPENISLTEHKDNKQIISNDNNSSGKGWRNRENRKEFYSALSALQGLAVVSAVG